MPQRRTSVERLGAFSDAVFAVIITIMVLELKPPEQPTFCGATATAADCAELCGELSASTPLSAARTSRDWAIR